MEKDNTTCLKKKAFWRFTDNEEAKWIVSSDINKALEVYNSISMDIPTWENNKSKITHKNIKYRIGEKSGLVGVWIDKPKELPCQ